MRKDLKTSVTRRHKRTMSTTGGDRSMMTSSKLTEFLNTIKTCPKKGRDPSSLSFLVKRDISQSAAIRLGVVLEEVFNIVISEYFQERFTRSNLKRNVKGERQKDLLMINETDKSIIYAELKANINLDTQKAPATVASTIKVVQDYEAGGYTIQGYVLSLRYLKTSDIPKNLVKKYQAFDAHPNIKLIGIQDFMRTVLDEPITELQSEASYSEFLTALTGYIEACSSE